MENADRDANGVVAVIFNAFMALDRKFKVINDLGRCETGTEDQSAHGRDWLTRCVPAVSVG
jgi:hypothetical protein